MPHGNYKFQSYVNTTAGTEDYALPSNLIHLIHPIRLILGSGTSDSGYALDKLSKEEYDIRHPNPNWNTSLRGRPSAYTVYSRSILLTPIPDVSTYYLEINWSKRITAQSAASDVSSLGSEWDEVLMQGTLERLYQSMQMYEDAAIWGSKYHIVNPVNGDDIPVGLCKRLFDIERDREEKSVGTIEVNNL